MFPHTYFNFFQLSQNPAYEGIYGHKDQALRPGSIRKGKGNFQADLSSEYVRIPRETTTLLYNLPQESDNEYDLSYFLVAECYLAGGSPALGFRRKTGYSQKNRSEVNVRKLPWDQQELFHRSREKEWQKILDNKAVTILTEAEAREICRLCPERILDSRYVDTWTEEDGQCPEAKSRWRVQGHGDPEGIQSDSAYDESR